MTEDGFLFNAIAAAATLPPALNTAYRAWQPVEGREARLGRLTRIIAADFRTGSGVANDPIYVEKTEAVPLRCIRHCEAVLWYTLALECGAEAEPYRPGWQDAEVWLRQLYVALRQGATGMERTGTPRYSGAPLTAAASIAITSGGGASGGVVTQPINAGWTGRPVRPVRHTSY